MDLRFFYWILFGVIAEITPAREYLFIIGIVLYAISMLYEHDFPGLLFGLLNVGYGYLVFEGFIENPNRFAIWVIVVSLNYLVIKKYYS